MVIQQYESAVCRTRIRSSIQRTSGSPARECGQGERGGRCRLPAKLVTSTGSTAAANPIAERVVAGAFVTDADAHGRDGRTLEAEPVERLGVYDVHGPVALDQSLNVVDGEFAVTVDDVL